MAGEVLGDVQGPASPIRGSRVESCAQFARACGRSVIQAPLSECRRLGSDGVLQAVQEKLEAEGACAPGPCVGMCAWDCLSATHWARTWTSCCRPQTVRHSHRRQQQCWHVVGAHVSLCFPCHRALSPPPPPPPHLPCLSWPSVMPPRGYLECIRELIQQLRDEVGDTAFATIACLSHGVAAWLRGCVAAWLC